MTRLHAPHLCCFLHITQGAGTKNDPQQFNNVQMAKRTARHLARDEQAKRFSIRTHNGAVLQLGRWDSDAEMVRWRKPR